MILPKNNTKLTEIFKSAETPDISEFNGKYFVDMLTMLPSLRKFNHRKYFHPPEKGQIRGHNILFRNTVWGNFIIEQGTCEEIDANKIAVINYNVPENPTILKNFRDQVKRVKFGSLYLGRLIFTKKEKTHFWGYFSLTKK